MSLPAPSTFHRWLRRAFLVWAVVSTSYVLNTFRTRGVPAAALADDAGVAVESTGETFTFRPLAPSASGRATGLLFLAGAGVSAEAYAPLLRPLAEAGYPVIIVRLPLRMAPLESHKQRAIRRASAVLSRELAVERWVLAGHSLGAALACRLAPTAPSSVAALVLVATTHPRDASLSGLAIPVTKVYATHDGVAPIEKIAANRHLLPPSTRWVEIEGGNHSQFGHYGRQLLDGSPAISREAQQERTRAALLDVLAGIQGGSTP